MTVSITLTDEYFEKLAVLKEQEQDPVIRGMTFQQYAQELLERAIWTRYAMQAE